MTDQSTYLACNAQITVHPLAKGITYEEWWRKLPRNRLVNGQEEKLWWAKLRELADAPKVPVKRRSA